MAKKKEQPAAAEVQPGDVQPVAAKKPTTIKQAIVAVTGVGDFIAGVIASECSEELQQQIVAAYDARKPGEEIKALIGTRKAATKQAEGAAQPNE